MPRPAMDYEGGITEDERIVCKWCVTGEAAAKGQKVVAAKVKDMVKTLVSFEGSAAVNSIGTVREVLAELYSEFSGPVGFARELAAVIQRLASSPTPSTAVAKIMLDVIKLHQRVEDADNDVAARDMSDEQIRRAMEVETMRMILDAADNPAKRQVLESVLQSRGLSLREMSPADMLGRITDSADDEMLDQLDEMDVFLKQTEATMREKRAQFRKATEAEDTEAEDGEELDDGPAPGA